MSYRAAFLSATDPSAYTAIRHKVDGSIEPIAGMRAGQDLDSKLEISAAPAATFGANGPT